MTQECNYSSVRSRTWEDCPERKMPEEQGIWAKIHLTQNLDLEKEKN
jgi:hypothetical protein